MKDREREEEERSIKRERESTTKMSLEVHVFFTTRVNACGIRKRERESDGVR